MSAQAATRDNANFGRFGVLLTVAVVFVAFYIGDKYDPTYAVNMTLGDERAGAAAIAEAAAGRGSGMRPAMFAMLGMFGVLAWMMRPSSAGLAVRGWLPALLVVFVAFVALSITWALEPDTVMRRIVIFMLMSVAALGLASRLSMRGLVVFALLSCLAVWFIGVAAEIAIGSFQPWRLGYRFSGLQHPNATGGILAIAVLAAVALARLEPRRRKLLLFIAVAAIAFLVLTKSRSAMGGLVAGFWTWWFLGSDDRKRVLALSLLAIALLGPIAAFVFGDGLGLVVQKTVLLGREAQHAQTFTGRVPLWTLLVERYVDQRPLLGYGFDGFWTPRHVLEVTADEGWTIYHAHSAYVNMLLDLGLFGFILFIAVTLVALSRSYRNFAMTRDRGWLFMTAILAWVAVNNFLEPVMPGSSLRSFVAMLVIAKLAISELRPVAQSQPAFA